MRPLFQEGGVLRWGEGQQKGLGCWSFGLRRVYLEDVYSWESSWFINLQQGQLFPGGGGTLRFPWLMWLCYGLLRCLFFSSLCCLFHILHLFSYKKGVMWKEQKWWNFMKISDFIKIYLEHFGACIKYLSNHLRSHLDSGGWFDTFRFIGT